MKKLLFSILGLILIVGLYNNYESVAQSNQPKSKIKKGRYLPPELLIAEKINTLPFPYSSENYIFLQSIGKVTNVIIGEFLSGKNKITFITDKDADGKVDLIMYYYFDTHKFRKQPKPESIYPPDKFKKLKMDIINGIQGDLNSNAEGVPFIKSQVKNESINTKIYRKRHGYKVFVNDADNKSRNRLNFFYSNNGIHGFDLVFQVKYINVRGTMLKPAIMFSVYCKNSFDPVVKDAAKDLITFTSQYYAQ